MRRFYCPLLRGRAMDVRGYLCRDFTDDIEPAVIIDGVEERGVARAVREIRFDGVFRAVHHASWATASLSALFARIITEGILGLAFTDLGRAQLHPYLPAAWDRLALRGLRIGGRAHDIELRRAAGGGLTLRIDGATARSCAAGQACPLD